VPRLSKHRELSANLRAAIADGRHPRGGKLPGEVELARRHGVSRPTVARALRDLQREGIVERRPGSGTYVAREFPGWAAPAIRQIGLIVPGLDRTEIFQLICGELAGLARAQNYSLVWGGSSPPEPGRGPSLADAEELCRQFIQLRMSGVFFAPCEWMPGREESNRRMAVSLREAGVPVILLDRDLGPFPNRSDFDLVGLDNLAGGYLVAEHFIKLGCRRLRFVALPGSAPTVDARIAGVREAIARHGLDTPADWIRLGDPSDPAFGRKLVAGGMADAIVCANDDTAARLMKTLKSLGVAVPRQIRLAGFDDVKFATLVSPPLTTVHQPCREIAETAFRALLERVAQPALPPRSLLLAPRLVVRESCGAYLPRVPP